MRFVRKAWIPCPRDARIVYFGLETLPTAYTRMYLDPVVLDSDKNNIGVLDAARALWAT